MYGTDDDLLRLYEIEWGLEAGAGGWLHWDRLLECLVSPVAFLLKGLRLVGAYHSGANEHVMLVGLTPADRGPATSDSSATPLEST